MGGSSSDEVESTQTMTPWGPQQPHLEKIMGEGGRLYGQGGPGYYPGQTFAGRDPLSDQAQNLRLNYAMNSMPGQIYDMQRAQSFALNSPDAANNPYVQGMIDVGQNRLNENLMENMLPAIQSGAVASGQMGGSRQGIAQGLAMRTTNRELADLSKGIMGDAYKTGLGAQQGALALAPNIMQAGMAPMDVMGQVGQYNQGIDQQALEHDMTRWGFNQERPWDALGRYANITNQGSGYGTTTSTQPGGSGSPIAGALGGALAGSSLAGPLGGLGASMGLGMSGGAMGPSTMLAAGAANPLMLPLIIGGGLLGSGLLG